MARTPNVFLPPDFSSSPTTTHQPMARFRPTIPDIAAPAVPAGAAGASGRGHMGRSVYGSIRTAILDCTFLPGMALSEQALSDGLQVSRAPVREAFRQLGAEGLLEVLPQRGTFVARLSRARIQDAIFVREAIECKAAELAALAPLAERRTLEDVLARQAGASDRKDYTTHLSTDEEFHHRILELAGHPHAWAPLRLARTGMNRIRHLAIPEVGSNRIAIDQHREVVNAIVAGDAARAAEVMRVHIQSPLVYVDAIQQRFPEYFDGA
jgi:GntR family transcriptional regulator, rspAB operon transcriptional repressor